jgi:hypothetical protein
MAPPSSPRNILNRANQARRPNALDYIDTTNIIFEHLRRAILQQQELHNVAMAIANGVAAQLGQSTRGCSSSTVASTSQQIRRSYPISYRSYTRAAQQPWSS